VPLTTRPRREEELDGRDYRFLDRNEFQAMIADGRMLYWDYTLGHYYGFDAQIDADTSVITHALSRMALRIKRSDDEVVLVFLKPRDEALHLARLHSRFPDPHEFEGRRKHVEEELVHSPLFDHVLAVSGAEEAVASEHEGLWKLLGFLR